VITSKSSRGFCVRRVLARQRFGSRSGSGWVCRLFVGYGGISRRREAVAYSPCFFSQLYDGEDKVEEETMAKMKTGEN
jgi:hypothetical protein